MHIYCLASWRHVYSMLELPQISPSTKKKNLPLEKKKTKNYPLASYEMPELLTLSAPSNAKKKKLLEDYAYKKDMTAGVMYTA